MREKGANITNSTDPISITKNVTLTVIDCCASPPSRLLAHCIAADTSVAVSVVSSNIVTIGSAIHFVTEIFVLFLFFIRTMNKNKKKFKIY